ncbi:hypothetical protein EXIGLDRAFT_777143 [Exidia glandulosa HHB12029]|uniref:Uncharacterized protein n=1 Tax=Exidia glandulosa HHB12029 TaxID=1314781 RepID=A0A165D5X5_EXIGL|nr:hypothetical protein EXIGLDRAFT_777143 [Exidia glandulosa HHB12029]
MDDPDVVSLDDHFEGRQLQPLHSTNVFIYIYPTTLRPGTLQPDIDNRFSELLVTLERAGLHFVATLPAVGNVLPHLLSQLRIHLNAMRITFPHPDDETGIPWTPVKFYRTSEAAPWLMRAVSRADLPDRYFTLDRLLRNGILHTQPPHPQHETLMLWIAPMFEPVTGPLVHFMDANAYRISGAHGSHGMADVHGCYAARVVWPFLQPRPGAEGEPECGTNCPNGYVCLLPAS